MVMSTPTRKSRQEKRREAWEQQVENLAERIAELTGEVRALTQLKDHTTELRAVEEKLEKAKLEQERLTEKHAREVRETEHRVGLLLQKQEQDVANATREAKLAVREENLAADKDRFKAEMEFQRKALESQMTDLKTILSQVFSKLPDIQATFAASTKATTGTPRPAASRAHKPGGTS